MPHEDLYDEMLREEEAAAKLYQVKRSGVLPTPKQVDTAKARANYEKDFKPLIERVKRVKEGKPITKNPLYNAWLKITRQDKLPTPDVLEPTQEFRPIPPKENP